MIPFKEDRGSSIQVEAGGGEGKWMRDGFLLFYNLSNVFP